MSAGVRRLGRIGLAGLVGLVWGITGGGAARGDDPPRHSTPHHVKAPAAPAPAAENLVVHGQRRFSPAPMPNQEIHDPADQLLDPNTGASIGKFGRAYIDANPVPPINPELKGDQSPIAAGIQR